MKTMQKKKIVAGITAIVVLALLFAGVGYAFSGTARTYNQGDEQTLAYMSVTPKDFNPIFTGSTIFDTYVYDDSGIKTAYAFDSEVATVKDVIIDTTTYKAVLLGTKNMTVLNNTGAEITALSFAISGTAGNGDFVYIFKLTNTESFVSAASFVAGVTYYVLKNQNYVEANPQPTVNNFGEGTYYVQDTAYVVFNGSAPSPATISASLADTEDNVITVDVYLGYVPNVYVPSNYIGPAADNVDGYAKAAYWESNVTYYTDKSGTQADPQPTNQTEFAGMGTLYKQYTGALPYILPSLPENIPADLLKTSFGIEVTDANA